MTPRCRAVVVPVALLLVALGAQPAAAAPVPPYTYMKLFAVADGSEQQALGFAAGHHFVAFDRGAGARDRILELTGAGAVVKDAGSLDLGHAAEMGYRLADRKLYVANGGTADDAEVSVVDMRAAKPVVEDTYDFTSLGHDAMVAVDNVNDRMVVFAGPSRSSDVVAFASFASGTLTRGFTVPDLGTPNGLEVVGSQVLYLTTLSSTQDQQKNRCNTITAFDFAGSQLYALPLPLIGEAEGLSADQSTGRLYVGLRPPGAVYQVSPAWTSPLGSNLLVNGDAECNDGARGTGTAVNVSGWSDTGDAGAVNTTAVRYGASSGYPGSSTPGPSDRGANFFTGGTSSRSTLTQSVNLSGFASAIDRAPGLTYDLEGWLGGYLGQSDAAQVVVTFRDRSGTTIGSSRIGPVLAADRANETALLRKTAKGTVPIGTRSASVAVISTRGGGTNNDGYADDVSLTLNKV